MSKDGDDDALPILEIVAERGFGRVDRFSELAQLWTAKFRSDSKTGQRFNKRVALLFKIVVAYPFRSRHVQLPIELGGPQIKSQPQVNHTVFLPTCKPE
jgi:hypothetical protein